VTYYDGEGFMVRKSRNAESGLELGDSKVCVQASTSTQFNVADYFHANNMKYQEINFAKLEDVLKAYDEGQCDVLTTDVSQLYAFAAAAHQADRSCHSAGCHFKRAARASRAPARR